MVKTLAIALCVIAIQAGALTPDELLNSSIKSHTGQFTVQRITRLNSRALGSPMQVPMAGGWAFVMPASSPSGPETAEKLDPALLITSCERVKQAVLFELNIPDRWRGRIDLKINSSLAPNAEPILNVLRAPAGWRYEMQLPPAMIPRRLSRALINVVLLEMANRSAVDEPTQIPFWLVEGMVAQTQAADSTVVLQSNLRTIGTMLLDEQKKPLLLQAPQLLIGNPALFARLQRVQSQPVLTFDELSWPPKELTSNANAEEIYQASAHLFLYQLINLEGGREHLCRFLEALPAHLNWQLSFLEAYPDRFSQLRDVEKWWGLACMQPPGYNMARWSPVESGQRLQESLTVPVQTRNALQDSPVIGRTTLQRVVLKWETGIQMPALQKTCADLVTLRPRLDPAYIPVLDRYCQVLQKFQTENSPKNLEWMRTDSAPQRSREVTARQLTELDKTLADLRLKPASAPAQTNGPIASK